MKVLYLDESGTPELSSQDKYVVVCGVLIDEDDEKSFRFLVERVKRKYGLDLDKHLHAVDIFENTKRRSYLGQTKRRKKKDLRNAFQRDMWDIIKDFDIAYYSVTVSKDAVRRLLGLQRTPDKGRSWIRSDSFYAKMDRQLPLDVGANAIYHWAIRMAKKSKLKVIFESRPGDFFTVRNHNYVRENLVFKSKHMIAFADTLKKSVVLLGFANKEVKSVALELADIIAYTCNIYFLQSKKRTKNIPSELKKAISFKGMHKTLGVRHYKELNMSIIRKYIPGLANRTRRITEYYTEAQ